MFCCSVFLYYPSPKATNNRVAWLHPNIEYSWVECHLSLIMKECWVPTISFQKFSDYTDFIIVTLALFSFSMHSFKDLIRVYIWDWSDSDQSLTPLPCCLLYLWSKVRMEISDKIFFKREGDQPLKDVHYKILCVKTTPLYRYLAARKEFGKRPQVHRDNTT